MTYNNCGEIADLFAEAINNHKTEIILDCKSVPFIDSAGLELLVNTNTKLKKQGGGIRMVSLCPLCMDILMVTRLINIIPVHSDIHEAIRSTR